MISESCRLQFDSSIRFNDVRETLALALLTCESLHGVSKVALDADYHTDEGRLLVEIGLNNKVGEHLALVLIHLARAEFGEDGFALSRIRVDRGATVSGGTV